MAPLRRFAFLILVFVVGLLGSACSRDRPYVAAPVETAPVRIVVGRAVAQGDRLYVEAQVTNTGEEEMVIDRNGVTLVLEDGQVLARSVGITSTKQPYRLDPGRTRAVHVDFRAEGFRWRDVERAKVDWSHGISVAGRNVPLEPMALKARSTN